MAKLSDYIKFHPKQQEVFKLIGTGKTIFFGGSRSGGKSGTLDSKVLTPFGFKKMRDIKIGDMVSNPDGSNANVIAIHPQGILDTYKVKTIDGGECTVSGDHLWLAKITNRHQKMDAKYYPFGDEDRCELKIYTTEMLKKELDNDNNKNILIPLTKPVEFTRTYRYPESVWSIDPYTLGVLLGDGCLRSNTISIATPEQEILDYFSNIYKDDLKITQRNNCFILRLIGESRKDLIEKLTKMGIYDKLANAKYIPESYKTAPLNIRYSIIQGLFDTDGYADERGHIEYSTVSEQLAKDVQWIIRSLGGKATINTKIGKYRDENGDTIECQLVYRLYINIPDGKVLFRLPRKKERCVDVFSGGHSILKNRIVSIEPNGKEECQCITVSNMNGLYITDDFIVTHNSYLAFAACFIICLKYPGIKCVIIRRNYGELVDNFIDKLKLFPKDVFGYKLHKQEKRIIFNNGSIIALKSIENDRDAEKVLGVEYQFVVLDEGNQQDTSVIMKIFGSLRTTTDLVGFIPTMLITGNPGGRSDGYFKSHFINPDYTKWTESELKNKDDYVFVKSTVYDNPSVTADYREKKLEALEPELREAWLLGNWDVFFGQFFTIFSVAKHVVPDFSIPANWRRICGIDLGFTKKHPFVCLWAAQDPDTLKVYIYREYVGVGSIDTYIKDVKDLSMGEEIEAYYCDPMMWGEHIQKRKDEDQSAAQMMLEEGIPVVPANNSRVQGWAMVKEWLDHNALKEPMMQFFESCTNLIETLPSLQYVHGKTKTSAMDLDSDGADDAADALRYLTISALYMPTVAMRYILNHPEDYEETNTIEYVRDEIEYQGHKQLFDSYNAYY